MNQILKGVCNSSQFKCLLAWYKQNKDVCPEEKKKLLGTIDLDLFTATELFQLVKPSGLFPDDEVDERILKHLGERDKVVYHKEWRQAANSRNDPSLK